MCVVSIGWNPFYHNVKKTLEVHYLPKEKLVELKSLKYYLTSFRNVGILQEHVVNRILNDLVDLIQPEWLEVALYCRERGGIKTEVYATYPPSDPD